MQYCSSHYVRRAVKKTRIEKSIRRFDPGEICVGSDLWGHRNVSRNSHVFHLVNCVRVSQALSPEDYKQKLDEEAVRSTVRCFAFISLYLVSCPQRITMNMISG